MGSKEEVFDIDSFIKDMRLFHDSDVKKFQENNKKPEIPSLPETEKGLWDLYNKHLKFIQVKYESVHGKEFYENRRVVRCPFCGMFFIQKQGLFGIGVDPFQPRECPNCRFDWNVVRAISKKEDKKII